MLDLSSLTPPWVEQWYGTPNRDSLDLPCQELLDGLHALALIAVFPLHRDYSGQLQVAGYVFIQLHPGGPGVRGDDLGGVDGEQLGQGAGVGGAVRELTEHHQTMWLVRQVAAIPTSSMAVKQAGSGVLRFTLHMGWSGGH